MRLADVPETCGSCWAQNHHCQPSVDRVEVNKSILRQAMILRPNCVKDFTELWTDLTELLKKV